MRLINVLFIPVTCSCSVQCRTFRIVDVHSSTRFNMRRHLTCLHSSDFIFNVQVSVSYSNTVHSIYKVLCVFTSLT